MYISTRVPDGTSSSDSFWNSSSGEGSHLSQNGKSHCRRRPPNRRHKRSLVPIAPRPRLRQTLCCSAPARLNTRWSPSMRGQTVTFSSTQPRSIYTTRTTASPVFLEMFEQVTGAIPEYEAMYHTTASYGLGNAAAEEYTQTRSPESINPPGNGGYLISELDQYFLTNTGFPIPLNNVSTMPGLPRRSSTLVSDQSDSINTQSPMFHDEMFTMSPQLSRSSTLSSDQSNWTNLGPQSFFSNQPTMSPSSSRSNTLVTDKSDWVNTGSEMVLKEMWFVPPYYVPARKMNHHTTDHPGPINQQSPEPHTNSGVKCSQCGTKFTGDNAGGNLERHKKSKHGPPIPCKQCDRTYNRSDALRTHVGKFHEGGEAS